MVNVAGSLDILALLIGLVGGLLLILSGIIGWACKRFLQKFDEMTLAIASFDRSLRNDLAALDRRVHSVEVFQSYSSSYELRNTPKVVRPVRRDKD